jgi:GNAT superfamily N-acetyltransferase
MYEISAEQVTPAILSLFDFGRPTMPRAFNVLEGVTRGQILVDDGEYPVCAVVREAVYGTLYFGGRVTAATVASLVQHFRQIGEVGIGCWLDDPLNEMIPIDHDYDGKTLYFTERSRQENRRADQLPPGYSLAPRDEHLFLGSFDYNATLDSFGSIENVLKHTLGFVVLHGETIACEAATGASTRGRIEVGVNTAEEHRGRGLATIACARLIEVCEAKGLSTWWDCAKQNIPSTKLARKLGYRNEQEYRYVWWRPA